MHKKELIEQARYNRNYCMLTRKVFVFYLDGGKIKKKLSKIEGVEKNKYHDFFLWCVLRFPLFYWKTNATIFLWEKQKNQQGFFCFFSIYNSI